jgi:voltage-gated potassium channel
MERRRDPDAEPATALAGKAAAFLPWYLHWLYPLDLRLLRVFRLCRLLMLVRYSPALQTLGRVVARALLGGLLVILILLLFASSGMYLIERHMQQDKFGSIPQAAW